MGKTIAQKLIGVYEPSTPSRSVPDGYIKFDEARRLVKEKRAEFINRNCAIRRLRAVEDPAVERKLFPSPSRRGITAAPGPRLIERYAAATQEFDYSAIAAVEYGIGGRAL